MPRCLRRWDQHACYTIDVSERVQQIQRIPFIPSQIISRCKPHFNESPSPVSGLLVLEAILPDDLLAFLGGGAGELGDSTPVDPFEGLGRLGDRLIDRGAVVPDSSSGESGSSTGAGVSARKGG